jgi:uncharacterized membrane protein
VVRRLRWVAILAASVGVPVGATSSVHDVLNEMLLGPTGVALVCCGVAMWVSGLFPGSCPVSGSPVGH